MTLSMSEMYHYPECHNAEYHVKFIVMVNVNMLSIMFNFLQCWMSLCWVPLLWVSLCWVSLCWMPLCKVLLCWTLWRPVISILLSFKVDLVIDLDFKCLFFDFLGLAFSLHLSFPYDWYCCINQLLFWKMVWYTHSW